MRSDFLFYFYLLHYKLLFHAPLLPLYDTLMFIFYAGMNELCPLRAIDSLPEVA